jgi:hypothetical protein
MRTGRRARQAGTVAALVLMLGAAGCDDPLDARVTVSATPATVPPEGGTVNVQATVVEKGGGPLAGAHVTFTASTGDFQSGGTPLTTDATGAVVDVLTVPAVTDPVEVTATAADLKRTATVEVAIESRGGGR